MNIFKNNKEIIFLDTNSDAKNEQNSYIFINPVKTIIAFDESDFPSIFAEINELSKKYWLAGYIRYEAGYCFLPKIFKDYSDGLEYIRKKPLIWLGVYENPTEVENATEQFFYKPYSKIDKQIEFETYKQKIQDIKSEIKNGNTYQVNFAFDNLLTAYSSDENLYLSLRAQQKTNYSAFIRNEFDTILSFSPELFFKIDGNKISVKPMKGTICRGKDENKDEDLVGKILQDEKIKAENLMIVDLLRNDLGMIAKPGTVRVENLLEVETHSTLHQLTSTVSAKLRNSDYDFFNIFKALFPCGSVTGAPKIETMKIIRNLEKGERGVYCGAIGYISPNKKSVFSVPIRILQKENDNQWIYKVGGGIVWDSEAKNEWEETETKMLFLEKNKSDDFKLIETMLFKNLTILFCREHLDRLAKSAAFFGFKIDMKLVGNELQNLEQELALRKISNKILRLEIEKKGNFCIEKLDFVNSSAVTENVKISDIILDKKNIFLQHKTTYRPWYEETTKLIKSGKIWDEIFVNQDGEVCEGSRTNVFVKIDGKLWTPPVLSGCLNGILRQDLLKRKKCEEKKLYLKDLKISENIYLGNSVRGLVEVAITNF